MHDIGYSCDITSSIEKSDQVGKNFELAVVASMAFFKWKNLDMYKLCNGNKSTEGISKKVGMREINKDTGKSNYEEKQEAFILKLMPLVGNVFSVYDLSDDNFALSSDYDLLYTELTGATVLYIGEYGV